MGREIKSKYSNSRYHSYTIKNNDMISHGGGSETHTYYTYGNKKDLSGFLSSKAIYLFFCTLVLMLASTFISSNGAINQVYASSRVNKVITFELNDETYSYDASYYDYDFIGRKLSQLKAFKNPLIPLTKSHYFRDKLYSFGASLSLESSLETLTSFLISGDLIYIGNNSNSYKASWTSNYEFSSSISPEDKNLLIELLNSDYGLVINKNYYFDYTYNQYTLYKGKTYDNVVQDAYGKLPYSKYFLFNTLEIFNSVVDIITLPLTFVSYLVWDFVVMIDFIIIW